MYPSLGNLTTQIIKGNRGNQANSQASNDKTATSGSGGRIRRRSAPPVTLEGIVSTTIFKHCQIVESIKRKLQFDEFFLSTQSFDL